MYDADSLQIFHGLKLVTSHMRNDTPYGYTQKEAHKLPGRHGSYEKDLGEIYERAGAIDKGGVRAVDNIVEGTPA